MKLSKGFSFHRLACLLVLVGLLAGACDRGPALPPLAADATVVAFGDSLTRGTGAADAQNYPTYLAAMIGRPVVNAGVPGELSSEGRSRLPEVLDAHWPALLILCHGGNDLLRRRDDAATAENLRAMVSLARDRGIAVVLVGVPKPGILLSSAPFYEEIAVEFNIPFAGEVLPDILSDRSLKSDAIHPNAEGYALLAKRLTELLDEAGAL